MSCNNCKKLPKKKCGCKNKKFAKTLKERATLLKELVGGFCKIRIKFPGEKKLYNYVCTLKSDFIPEQGSINYRKLENTPMSNELVLWAINKNINTKDSPQSGWIKINSRHIVFFDPLDKK